MQSKTPDFYLWEMFNSLLHESDFSYYGHCAISSIECSYIQIESGFDVEAKETKKIDWSVKI